MEPSCETCSTMIPCRSCAGTGVYGGHSRPTPTSERERRLAALEIELDPCDYCGGAGFYACLASGALRTLSLRVLSISK
jgi:hypothetical protein